MQQCFSCWPVHSLLATFGLQRRERLQQEAQAQVQEKTKNSETVAQAMRLALAPKVAVVRP